MKLIVYNTNQVYKLVAYYGYQIDIQIGESEEFKFFTFFGITEMPPSVVNALQEIAPNYALRPDRFTQELAYRNACSVCGFVFDDENLRSEPGDAFMPLETADYERIQLIDIGCQIDYQLRLDEDEHRTFDGIEAGCWNPAPDLWQVLVEQGESSGVLIRPASWDLDRFYSEECCSIQNENLE